MAKGGEIRLKQNWETKEPGRSAQVHGEPATRELKERGMTQTWRVGEKEDSIQRTKDVKGNKGFLRKTWGEDRSLGKRGVCGGRNKTKRAVQFPVTGDLADQNSRKKEPKKRAKEPRT